MTELIDRRGLLMGLVAGSAALTLSLRAHAAEPVTIFAAMTLKDVVDASLAAAQSAIGVVGKAVYGPAPALVKQLENGAPGDIFFSADADWMDEAVKAKVVDPKTRVDLLSSKLVLIAPAAKASPVTIVPGFPLASMLGDGRLAVCDPMMMPAGRYGRAALQKLGVWDSVKNRIANAANIRAALSYVSRGEAPLGIVFDTDARLDQRVAIIGTFPADTHPPIVYPIADVARSQNPDTARLTAFLTSAKARPIFERYGYRFLPSGI
jgi:molybdate transport system substrate-binding protein